MIAQGISGGTVKHLITSRPDRSTTNRNIRQRRIAAVQSLSSNATSITGINAGERPPGGHWDNSGIYDRRPRLTRMIAQGTDGCTSKHFVKSRTRQSNRKQEYPNVPDIANADAKEDIRTIVAPAKTDQNIGLLRG